jgi:hypothetical protein
MTAPGTAAYANGLFGTDDAATNDAQLAQMMAAKFDIVILFAVHVHPSGDLYYNDSPIVSAGTFNPDFAYLEPYLSRLASVSQIWCSVGGWGVDDFQNLGTLLSTGAGRTAVTNNVAALKAGISLVGVDMDMEATYDPAMRTTVTTFSSLVAKLGLRVSFCPYTVPEFWMDCLADLYVSGKQIVDHLNLQCYAGGAGNTTTDWVDAMSVFPRKLGIDPHDFVWTSTWVQTDDGSEKYTPGDIEAFFAQPEMGQYAIGGFLWCTSEIFQSGFTAADYSTAIIAGLRASTTVDH